MFEPETLIVGKLPGAGPVVIQVSDTYGYLRRYTPEEILSLPFADLNFSIESVDFMLFKVFLKIRSAGGSSQPFPWFNHQRKNKGRLRAVRWFL